MKLIFIVEKIINSFKDIHKNLKNEFLIFF